MGFVLQIIILFGLILVSPIILFSLILVKLEDGSPTIFIQERLGVNKTIFKLYKVRTMYLNAPSLGTHQVDNSHHLKVAKVLRKFKFDELPQLINVIKGDLTLVGPRPGLPNQKELLEYRKKLNIFEHKPGITGLGQVLGYDMSNPKLLAMIDELYFKNKTFKLDVKIFFATFLSLYKKKLRLQFRNEINEIMKKINYV